MKARADGAQDRRRVVLLEVEPHAQATIVLFEKDLPQETRHVSRGAFTEKVYTQSGKKLKDKNIHQE